MTDNESQNAIAPVAYEAYPVQADPEEAAGSPVAALHRTMRGRYVWALGIGSVLAVGGVLGGVKLSKPTYRAVGLIDVAPRVKKILYANDDNGFLPLFDAYVLSETQTAGQRRVIDIAMASPEWRNLGRSTTTDKDIAKFRASLDVNHPRNSQNIEFSFIDTDPDAAMIGVNQVIDAYMSIVRERESKAGTEVIDKLLNLRANCTSNLSSLRQDVLAVTDGLGEAALQQSYKGCIERVNAYEEELRTIEVDAAFMKAAADAAATSPGRVYTEAEIAAKDPPMEQLLKQKAEFEDRIAELIKDEQLGEKHPTMIAARRDLDKAEKSIALRAQQFRALLAAAPEGRDAQMHELDLKRKGLTELHDRTLEECKRLAGKLNTLDNLKSEQAALGERLEEIKQRLQVLNTESDGQARISVISRGGRPFEPDVDRRLIVALIGAGSGLAVGFVVVLLWGLREAKLRHVADADGGTSATRFLGVLPDIHDPAVQEDGQTSAQLADFCVHNIRTTLQLLPNGKRRVVTLTSPAPGAGKTTVSLALAMSYAASGSRTLIVDFDFVGRGLSAATRSIVCDGASRIVAATESDAPGEANAGRPEVVASLVAARTRVFDDARIAELIEATRKLAGQGHAAAARASRALDAMAVNGTAAGGAHRPGVMGVLAGAPVEGSVVELDTPNLWLLPAGDASASDAETLSPHTVAQFVEACRSRFDTILIDTGPVLGSIEALLAASVSDDVVLVVARGERRHPVDDAVTRLEGVGAEVAGLIFNRATTDDVARTKYASRSASRAAQVA